MCRSAVQLCQGLRFAGGIAQLVEHMLCKHGVAGSNPTISTEITFQDILEGFFVSSIPNSIPVLPRIGKKKMCGGRQLYRIRGDCFSTHKLLMTICPCD